MSDDSERKRALGVYQSSQRLDEAIGRLKRAMIDSFMAEKVFGATFSHGGNRFEFKTDEYLLRSNAYPVEGDDHVARPDEFGNGGGRAWKTMIPGVWDQSYGDSRELDYTAEFDDIRAWVDNLVDKWVLQTPDPAYIGEAASRFDRVCTSLRPDGGTVSGHVNQLEQDLGSPDLAGTTIGAFRTKFVVNLRTVLNGHSCIAAVLASNMAAQRAAWEEVRAGFVLTVEAYTRVFRSLAGLEGGSPDANVQVRILRYAADAAADGPWATVLNLAAAALGLLALPKDGGKEDSRSPRSFAEGKSALEAALDALNRDLYDTEKSIRDTISHNIVEIGSTKRIIDGREYPDNRQHYDLSLAPITDFSVADPDRIGWDGSVIGSIADGPMREIAEGLHEQLRITTTWDSSLAEAVKRHSLLGLGTYGPSAAMHELNEMLCDLLGDLKWEVETGASQLWLAYDANMRHNDQAATDLAALNAQLPQGSGYDPWDYEPPRSPALSPGLRGSSTIPLWRMMVVPEFESRPEKVERESADYQWQERER